MTTRIGLIASSVTWLALVKPLLAFVPAPEEPVLALVPAPEEPVLALAPAPEKPVLALGGEGSGPPRDVISARRSGLAGFVTLSPLPWGKALVGNRPKHHGHSDHGLSFRGTEEIA